MDLKLKTHSIRKILINMTDGLYYKAINNITCSKAIVLVLIFIGSWERGGQIRLNTYYTSEFSVLRSVFLSIIPACLQTGLPFLKIINVGTAFTLN
jgi:hypothetical protein